MQSSVRPDDQLGMLSVAYLSAYGATPWVLAQPHAKPCKGATQDWSQALPWPPSPNTVSDMSRAYSAPRTGEGGSQGVALGWYLSSFQDSKLATSHAAPQNLPQTCRIGGIEQG